MAEGKKSFTAYCDWKETFDSLPDDKAGQLIKHLFSYVNDENPQTEDILIKAVFAQIKATLKRDLKKWELVKEDRSYNGRLGNLKRYNRDLYDKVVDNIIDLKEAENLAKSRKDSLSDNSDSQPSQDLAKLAVSDSVSVSVIDIDTTTKIEEVEVDFDLIDKWVKQLKNEQSYLNAIYMNNSLNKGTLSQIVKLFINHLKIYPKKHSNFSDFKKHFASWIGLEINKGRLKEYIKLK